ncbi:MAG: hypothetical protein PHX43_08555 [Alphaproteobacteria bacterium]|nr:hypothetical protein [Alphaproteobacteria bacterium]
MINFNLNNMLKLLAPKLLIKAFRAFDRATMVVVATCWSAALITMLFALYSLWMVGTAKSQVAAAVATEPSLPKMVTRQLSKGEADPLMDRLQKRFVELGFSMSGEQAFVITGVDGSRFRSWLTALSYIDTISPQYRWSIKEFCVGMKCSNSDLPMRAVLTAEKISFSAPTE